MKQHYDDTSDSVMKHLLRLDNRKNTAASVACAENICYNHNLES